MKTFPLIVMAITLFLTSINMPASAQQAAGTQVAQESASSPSTEVKPPKAPPIDPKSLVGKWKGEIVGQDSGSVVYFTFEKVEGNQVPGKFYIHAPWLEKSRYSNRDIDFVGTLDGNKIQIPGLPEFDLELVGNQIRGTWKSDNINFKGVIRDVKKRG